MQLVVVMAVRKAVRAATITFTATSMNFAFFIITYHSSLITPLVGVSFVATVSALGEHLRGHGTALAVLDGDGLDGSRVAQGDGLAVEGALRGRVVAVRGVVDLCTVRTSHGHLGRPSPQTA